MAETSPADRDAATTASQTTPVLETQNLVKSFGSLVAVDGVDLVVEEGEVHSIIGPNGAGKTTLFNTIAGTLAPDSGRILFRGDDITMAPEHERARRGIVRAFQITQLFLDLPIRENLRLAVQSQEQRLNPLRGPNPAHEKQADRMRSRLGLDVDPEVLASTLSHGDKKRLGIGMALSTDPDVLLLDEPTSGVAQRESRELMGFLRETKEDRTILLIEHNVDLVLEISDRITVLNRGSVIAEGPPAEITENEQVQQAYMSGY